jgi:CPA2 family monovalent cation:H+ antiporter-2/glutathione-regulated potassium-efflux system protein KefB
MAASARPWRQMLMASDLSVTMVDTDVEMIDVAGGWRQSLFRRRHRLDICARPGPRKPRDLSCGWMDGDQMPRTRALRRCSRA